jgi:tetratricopeptide (TPR) repeat protein
VETHMQRIFGDFIQGRRRRISKFISGRYSRLLYVTVSPEYEAMALRVIQSLEDETGVCNVFFSFDCAFVTASQYFADATKMLSEQLAVLAQYISVPTPEPSPTDEGPVAFARYADAVQDALQRYADHLVLVFFPAGVADPAFYAWSFDTLVRSSTSPMVKVIVRDDFISKPFSGMEQRLRGCESLSFSIAVPQITQSLASIAANPASGDLERSRALAMIAGIQVAQKNCARAIETLRQLATTARSSGDAQEQAAALFQLGMAYYQNREYKNARQEFETCLEIALENKIHGLSAHSVLQIGHTLTAEANYREALDFFDGAARYAHALNNTPLHCHALECAGAAMESAGDRVTAENKWLEAVRVCDNATGLLREVTASARDQVLYRLAALYDSTGRVQDAARLRSLATDGSPETMVKGADRS